MDQDNPCLFAGAADTRDLLDHLYGVFITASGRHRRLDIILAGQAERPFGMVSTLLFQ